MNDKVFYIKTLGLGWSLVKKSVYDQINYHKMIHKNLPQKHMTKKWPWQNAIKNKIFRWKMRGIRLSNRGGLVL